MTAKNKSKEYRKTYTERKAANKQCRMCSSFLFNSSNTLCEKHWYRSVAYKLLLRGNNVKSLTPEEFGKQLQAKALQQDYTCPYTNLQLTPTVDMSIDHRIPTAAGGTNCIDNLQWVHKNVNLMKWDISELEFIHFCTLIARNHSD